LKDFRKNITDELDNLKEINPSKYWTLLNDLSRDNGRSLREKWQPACFAGNLKLIRYKCALTSALVKFS
jgi:hypothetical protein